MKKRIFGIVLAAALVLGLFTLFSTPAHAASEMKASDDCIQMIQDSEGFRAIPYWDYSQWTVGFGTACPEEDLERYKKEGIPVEEAVALFMEQLARFEKAVNKFMDKHGLTLSQQQFDALVSFTYNLGSGSLNKETYTIVEAILSGATENEMVYAFSVYCMAGGEFQSGLMRRRMAEANLYLNGVYSEYPPESFCYVHYNANGGVRDASAQGYDANLLAVPLSRPTYEGYTFVGWYTEKEGGVKITTLDETTHGMTLYAHWEKSNSQADTPTVPVEGINVTVMGSVVHVRSGPGKDFGITTDVYAGEVLTITGTTQANGLLWGLCSKGWICLDHTNYFDIVKPGTEDETETLPVPPVYATVINPDGVTVYKGPHTTYPQVKVLSQDKTIELIEIMVFSGKAWGRYADGWIRLNSSMLVHDENTLAHAFEIVTTASKVTVRSGPGTSYNKETTLPKDASYRVYALVYTDGAYWGRIYEGWICLDYTNFDVSKLSQYQNHSYGEWYTYTASTCVTHGEQRRDCQYCDAYESREAELGAHGMGEWTVIQAPTCTAEGVEQRLCQYCSHSENRTISATGHTMSDWTVIQEATCVTDGVEQRTCQSCGHSETRAITATGHTMGDWVVTKEATAEASGEERRNCQKCDYFETRELVFSNHNFGEWYTTQEAACAVPGQQRRDCADCGHYELRELSPLGHDLGQWYTAQAPGCEALGQERRDCSRCEHCETRPLDAIGHDYGDWYESIPPTYTEHGQERRDCSRCDSYETRQTDKLPIPTVTRTYATVTCDKLRIRSGPGTSYSQVGWLYEGAEVEILEITKTGKNEWGKIENGWICLTDYTTLRTVEESGHTEHHYGDWYVSQNPTCTMEGQERRDCIYCAHSQLRALNALGHSYGQWYETIAPTTTSYGQERRDCTACGEYETRQTDMLTVVIRTYATVICDELRIRSGPGTSYSRVGWLYEGMEVEVFEITKVGKNEWGRIEKGWICLTDYTTLRTVEDTGHTEHVYGAWYETIAPTTTSYGQERRDCTLCGHYETRQTDMLKSETAEKVYATVTYETVTIRKGAGTSYAKLGKLQKGAIVEILEQKTVGKNVWGRISMGWICLTGHTSLATVTEEVSEQEQPVTMKVNTDSLKIRAGAGTSYSIVGYLYEGTVVEVYETVTVKGMKWARIKEGWICADYLK